VAMGRLRAAPFEKTPLLGKTNRTYMPLYVFCIMVTAELLTASQIFFNYMFDGLRETYVVQAGVGFLLACAFLFVSHHTVGHEMWHWWVLPDVLCLLVGCSWAVYCLFHWTAVTGANNWSHYQRMNDSYDFAINKSLDANATAAGDFTWDKGDGVVKVHEDLHFHPIGVVSFATRLLHLFALTGNFRVMLATVQFTKTRLIIYKLVRVYPCFTYLIIGMLYSLQDYDDNLYNREAYVMNVLTIFALFLELFIRLSHMDGTEMMDEEELERTRSPPLFPGTTPKTYGDTAESSLLPGQERVV